MTFILGFKGHALASRLRIISATVGVWALLALVSAAQGQLFAAYHGRSQQWWATLGYTAAIFSVWVLLTPAVLILARRLLIARLPGPVRIALFMLGYPIAAIGHVLLFALLFFPVYGASAATPLAMLKPVLLANFDKAAFAYAALIAVAGYRHHRHIHEAKRDIPGTVVVPSDGLWVRAAGGSHLVRFHEIDWIGAAGDYAEIHAGGRSLLTDCSLAALSELLPAADYARIHRGAIVRLDRVREVRSLGRGDANILLSTGQTLRLSRRYRTNLVAHLPF